MIYDSGVKRDTVNLAFKLCQRLFINDGLTVALSDTPQSGQTDTKWSTLCRYEVVPIGLLLIVFQGHPHLLKVNYYGGEEGIYKSDLHV